MSIYAPDVVPEPEAAQAEQVHAHEAQLALEKRALRSKGVPLNLDAKQRCLARIVMLLTNVGETDEADVYRGKLQRTEEKIENGPGKFTLKVAKARKMLSRYKTSRETVVNS